MTRNPWLVFLLPFVVYMLLTSIEPAASLPKQQAAQENHWGLESEHYPVVYAVKIVLTALVVVAVARGYPLWQQPRALSVLVGAVGVVLWVALAELQHRSGLTAQLLGAERPALNPWTRFAGEPLQLGVFLGFRFVGLVCVVPLIEEMYLRGLVMRYPQSEQWWTVPWGQVDRTALLFGTLIPVFLHLGEALAAVVWFSLIHWLYVRTRNIWDCVVAHAVTNLLLGAYVLKYEQWWLW